MWFDEGEGRPDREGSVEGSGAWGVKPDMVLDVDIPLMNVWCIVVVAHFRGRERKIPSRM